MTFVVILAVLALNIDFLLSQEVTVKENATYTPIATVKIEPFNKTAEPNFKSSHNTSLTFKNNKNETHNILIRLYSMVYNAIGKVLKEPKVKHVTKSIGICMVNGAMDVFSHFLPPSLMPLAVSAAGLLISFEPVAMLRERMPVSTYRRAFKKAMSGFLGTFEKYRSIDDDEDDPYLTRRFNRRFLRVMSSDEMKNKEG